MGSRTHVCGSLFFSNGLRPNGASISLDGSAGIGTQDPNLMVNFKLDIVGGFIHLNYPDFPDDKSDDEMLRASKHIIDTALLGVILRDGHGTAYSLEVFSRGNRVGTPIPDYLPVDPSIDSTALFRLNAVNQRVRYALRDFNSGLTNREDCPFFFYRAIETLAKAIQNKDEKLSAADWDEVHSKIGTTRAGVETVLGFSGTHRHGNHSGFSPEEHSEMLEKTRLFLKKGTDYLIRTTDTEIPPG